MASYKGAAREFYNIRRQLESRIKAFEKAGIEPPAELYSSKVTKIMQTTPAKASKELLETARQYKERMANTPSKFNVKGVLKARQEVLHRISAPPEEGGLGYSNVTEENKQIFFDFMDYVREKFENMRFDSDIYAAAANEMLGQAKRRGVTADQLKANFERYANQAIRITTSNRTLINYQQNFNRLSRRLGL